MVRARIKDDRWTITIERLLPLVGKGAKSEKESIRMGMQKEVGDVRGHQR